VELTSGALGAATDCDDDTLVRRLADGQPDALGPLYARHARFVFNVAAQTLDRPAAEEIVQDVFLTVWRRAEQFDPARGSFRTWIHRIAQTRVLNELRRRGRRPRIEPDREGAPEPPDPDPDPAEIVWLDDRRAAVRAALADLPAHQRQVITRAFFDGLSYQQVASALDLPLGTTKTRIRAGLQRLRSNLATIAAAALAVGLLGLWTRQIERNRATDESLARDERALALVTSSEPEEVRMVAGPGVPAATHGLYRYRTGATLAVVTLSNAPAAPAGQPYTLWARIDGSWRALGRLAPDPAGAARLILEGPELARPPAALAVTLEPTAAASQSGSPTPAAPSGPVLVAWTAP
jgi:RNA polymerase sigma-70 factor (ECF subfamily)